AVGILLTLLAEKWDYVPSPSAMGIGMLITAAVLLTFILGGVAQLIWARVSPDTEKTYRIPLASGLICGEAIIAVVLAIMAAAGVNFRRISATDLHGCGVRSPTVREGQTRRPP